MRHHATCGARAKVVTSPVRRRVRPPAVAGTFYPKDPSRLALTVDRLLDEAKQAQAALAGPASASDVTSPPLALLVPHAGYVYSGPVAAHAYARLLPFASEIRRYVLLGPEHRGFVERLALPDADAWATPLGEVEIDADLEREAASLPGVVRDARAHAAEHSLEVQLPFLQRVSSEFQVLPLLVGSAGVGQVAEFVGRFLGRPQTVVVISSDLSHYLPYDEARRVDAETVRRISELDVELVTHDEACGATPLNGFLLAARRAHLTPVLLDLRNSGDTAGPREEVVGYASFAFARNTT
jgi:hypothetical protein